MQKVFLDVSHCGNGYAPKDWWLAQTINIIRLYYIKGGDGGYFDQTGKKVKFKANHIYIHPYNLRDHFYTSYENPIDHIFFDFVSTPPILAEHPLCYPVDPDSPIASFLSFLQKLFSDSQMQSTQQSKLFPAHLLQTLLFLLDQQAPIPFSGDTVICESLEWIRKNYQNPIQVKQLAEHSGYELNYFIRRFKNAMGVTPYTYLKNYRLLQAEDLLSQGCSFETTAVTVGYQNASSLSRALSQKNKPYKKPR